MTGHIEKTVFISYRRTNLPWTLAIYQNLTYHGYDVFFDYESINSGDFEQIILGNIKARAHFIVILTPSALERCQNPDDWLRSEIETALDHKRNVVPLMMEGFNFGSPSIANYLTGKLALLNKYNGLNVPSDYFDEAMERLRDKYLNIALDAVLHPLSNMVVKAVREQQVAANKATPVKQEELSAQEWFEQGNKHIEAKDLDEAIHCYSEAIRLQPDDAYAFNNRGNARSDKHDFDGAIKDYTEAIRLKSDYADVYYNRGVVRDDKGDFDGAIKDYTEAIRLKPDHAIAFNSRGLAHFNKGDFDGAIKDFSEAIRLKPDHANYFNNRGVAHIKKEEVDEAIKDFSEALRLKPDHGYVFNNRGRMHFNKGDFDEAIKDYAEAIRLQPDYADVYCNRAGLWEKKKDYSSAIEDYQKYLELGGDRAEVEETIKELKSKLSK